MDSAGGPGPDQAAPEPGYAAPEPDQVASQPDHAASDQPATKGFTADRAARLRAGIQSARLRNPALATVLETVDRDIQTGGSLLASAVAFRVFLFLVPYAFVIVTGLGFSDTVADRTPGQLAHDLGIGGLLLISVSSGTHLSWLTRVVALVGGAIATLLAGRALLRALRVSHALIWRVPLPAVKSTIRPLLVLLGLVTAGLLFSALLHRAHSLGLAGAAATALFSMAVPAGMWLYASLYLPRADVPFWALIPGTAVVGIGVLVLDLFTEYWLAGRVDHRSATYGAMASALAMLLWAYLLGRLLTTSAEVNASLWYRSRRRVPPDHPPQPQRPRSGWPLEDAVFEHPGPPRGQ